MNRTIAVISGLAFASAGCHAPNRTQRAPSRTSNPDTVTHQLGTFRLAVYGMTCDRCAEIATRKVRELSGVVHVDVDYDSKQGVVRGEPGRITLADIQSALQTLGFEGLPPDQRPIIPLADDKREALDIRTISLGERIDERGRLLGQVQGNFIERIEAIIRSHASPSGEAQP